MNRQNDDISILKCYEIFSGTKCIGRAQISDKPGEGRDPDTRFVKLITIDKDYQRRGIATHLYQVIERDLAAIGLRLVESKHQSDDAVAFWEDYKRNREGA